MLLQCGHRQCLSDSADFKAHTELRSMLAMGMFTKDNSKADKV
jgi:hypothetical protein